MVWALQGSESVDEYYVHLAKFSANYPDVKVHYIFLVSVVIYDTGHTDVEFVVRARKAYLEQIPKEDWVHYAQWCTYLWLAHVKHGGNRYGVREKNEVSKSSRISHHPSVAYM